MWTGNYGQVLITIYVTLKYIKVHYVTLLHRFAVFND